MYRSSSGRMKDFKSTDLYFPQNIYLYINFKHYKCSYLLYLPKKKKLVPYFQSQNVQCTVRCSKCFPHKLKCLGWHLAQLKLRLGEHKCQIDEIDALREVEGWYCIPSIGGVDVEGDFLGVGNLRVQKKKRKKKKGWWRDFRLCTLYVYDTWVSSLTALAASFALREILRVFL